MADDTGKTLEGNMVPVLKTPPEITAFRSRFPTFRDSIHLASNSMGAVSDVVIDAQKLYLDERLKYGTTWRFAMPRHEELRASFADMIGAKPHEVALCCSATQALGVIASCFDWKDRPGIVFDEYSFPSTTYLWRAQEQRGARVRRLDARGGGDLPPGDFLPFIDKSVQLVAVSHVCYKNGYRQDIPTLARHAHDAGALLVVDDYQCFGSRKVDVKADNIDILVTGAAKYLLGSPGLGFIYVREELLDRLHPTLTGWFGQEDMNEFQIDRHDEASDARRFQTGTPALSAIYESLASMNLLKAQGMDRVGDWVEKLTGYAIARLDAAGYTTATPFASDKRGPQISIRAENGAVAIQELARAGIICSSRDGNIRTAWHYYNDVSDADALIAALDRMPADVISRKR